jgi:hypothetical protein
MEAWTFGSLVGYAKQGKKHEGVQGPIGFRRILIYEYGSLPVLDSQFCRYLS